MQREKSFTPHQQPMSELVNRCLMSVSISSSLPFSSRAVWQDYRLHNQVKNQEESMCCQFSHDVTKIETTKLLILLRFNFMMYKGSLKLLFIQIFAPNELLALR